jgi:hypothetical protein
MANTKALRGPKKRRKTDRLDARHLRVLLMIAAEDVVAAPAFDEVVPFGADAPVLLRAAGLA